jgi:kynurenine formamidase
MLLLLLLLLLLPLLLLQNVVVIEGLDLSQVQPGWYHQMCLPAKLAGSDGAPVRCVLQQLVTKSKHSEL